MKLLFGFEKHKDKHFHTLKKHTKLKVYLEENELLSDLGDYFAIITDSQTYPQVYLGREDSLSWEEISH